MAPSTSDAPREPSQPPPAERVFGLAALAAIVTGGAVVAYAFLAPAVYRTSAVVSIEPAQAKDTPALGPLEASRKLHEAVLDGEVLERLAKEQSPAATTEARIQIARGIQNGFRIDSVDGRSFTISVRDSEKERVAERCNFLAARAVERGPSVLTLEPKGAPADGEAARQRNVEAMMAFLTQHPEFLAEGGDKTPPSKTLSEADLRSERDQIQKLLASRPDDSPSDNPYADKAPPEQTTRLVQRLAQINARLARGLVPAKASKETSAALTAEWQRLVAAMTQNRGSAEATKPSAAAFTARLISPAAIPAWPIEPDRPMFIGWAALAALGAFIGTWLAARSFRGVPAGSHSSSYPPPGGFASSSAPPEYASSSKMLAAPPVTQSPLPLQLAADPFPAANAPAPVRGPALENGPSDVTPLVRPPVGVLRSLTRTMVLPGPSPATLPALPPAETPERPDTAPPPATDPSWPGLRAQRSEMVAIEPPKVAPASVTPPPVEMTPVRTSSSVPPRSIAPRSERAPRAAVEVNAEVSAPTRLSSSPPAAKNSPARTTQVLGSPIPPIIAPGSRRTPGAGSPPLNRQSPAPPNTGYSYVNTGSSSPPRPKASSSAPPSSHDSNVVAHPAPPGWRADLSLLPEARRTLVREICPMLPDHCVVIAAFGQTRTADAKSRLAAELALSLADSGHLRVLLLEGDLQHPCVQRFMRLGMPEREGFSDQLRARIDVHARRPWAVMECTASLHVLAEGLNRAPELILSRPFEDCLRELRAFYDFIVIDGPLLSEVPACRAVQDVMDNGVLVRVEGSGTELPRLSELFSGKPISVVSVR